MISSLSGKEVVYKWNLKGKIYSDVSNIPLQIKKLKIRIMDTLLLPLLSKQWNVLQNNLFLLDSFKQKINFYYNSYKLEEILLYKDIISLCELFVTQNSQLVEAEEKMYNLNSSNKNITNISFVYKTTMIKLKPEYEIYDSILGKPQKIHKQTYNEIIVQEIQKLITEENITYDKIKTYIEKKYLI
jgi:hypothetical protein